MTVVLEITDQAGVRCVTCDAERFWLGAHKSNADITLDIPGSAGRLVEVQQAPGGQLRIRVEAGLPFPVRSVHGTVGTRFEVLLDGDVINVGPAMVKISRQASSEKVAEEIDPGQLVTHESAGAPVGSWYQTFMDVADSLEGLRSAARMIQTAMEAILRATGADRVMVELDEEHAIDGQRAFYLSQGEDRTAFRISRTLLDQVADAGRVVHVPVAAADPVASRFQSVRHEGISSTIAMPVRALGKTLGFLYADCVRQGRTLSANDLQRVAFIGRLLAGALGNRDLVSTLVRAEPSQDAAVHPALQTASPAYATVIEQVKLYAPTNYTVLVRGETGTGKEVLARALHDLSRRKKGPFVPVNCAAIPGQLMESMLFGHERGAYTGATQSRRGHFEEAHGGTLFLDEIGDMALELQAKILRALQDRSIVPVGGRKPVKVDVRILAATHQDLEKMTLEGRFREDLYYRLKELEIRLPALRERLEDLPLLTRRFVREAAEELGLDTEPEIGREAMAALQRRQWRGNIRELRHVVKGGVLRAAGGAVLPQHFDLASLEPIPAGSPSDTPPAIVSEGASWKDRLEAQEKAALQETFARAKGNLTRAAELFGLPRTTYREKLVKFGILKSNDPA